MSYITTISGIHFDPIEPEEALLLDEDIAHALSLICRGNGHIYFFYSVAQHCLACAKEAEARGYSNEIILGSLLHDASEAYLSDVTRPVKKDLPYYLEVEDQLQNVIWKHYIGRELTEEEKKKIFEIDDLMLSMEFHQLFSVELNEEYQKLKVQFDCTFEDFRKVKQEYLDYLEKYSQEN